MMVQERAEDVDRIGSRKLFANGFHRRETDHRNGFNAAAHGDVISECRRVFWIVLSATPDSRTVTAPLFPNLIAEQWKSKENWNHESRVHRAVERPVGLLAAHVYAGLSQRRRLDKVVNIDQTRTHSSV
jgi:hypothetical protein